MPLLLLNLIIWMIGIVSAIAFSLILFTVNPFQAELGYLIAFFISFFLLLTVLFSLVGYYIREAINNKSNIGLMTSSIRQSSLISLYLLSIIIMEATNTFAVWQAILLLVVIVLLELYFR